MKIIYLTPEHKITAQKTVPASVPNVTGYGIKMPTSKMLQIDGAPRWYRVYVMQHSNAGSTFIVIKKVHHFLRDRDL